MLLVILALFSVFQQIQFIQAHAEPVKNHQNNTLLYSFICDDEALKVMEEKVGRLVKDNDFLRLKMDTMNMNMDQQFAKLKTVMEESLKKLATVDIQKNTQTAALTKYIDPINLPANCDEALKQSGRQRGIHKIHIPDSKLDPFFVYCLADTQPNGNAWTILQRRMDGSTNFYRKWAEYQQGFGNMEREFFIGLDKAHALTQSGLHELWIKMEDFENETRTANYSSFAIGGPNDAYALNILGSYTGDAGDSLSPHGGYKFTTQDKDNDIDDKNNCAVLYTGAWWYKNCHSSNLNGQYLKGTYSKDKYAKGVVWYAWHQHYYSLKYVHMAIRAV